jgi:hypothetical protein
LLAAGGKPDISQLRTLAGTEQRRAVIVTCMNVGSDPGRQSMEFLMPFAPWQLSGVHQIDNWLADAPITIGRVVDPSQRPASGNQAILHDNLLSLPPLTVGSLSWVPHTSRISDRSREAVREGQVQNHVGDYAKDATGPR